MKFVGSTFCLNLGSLVGGLCLSSLSACASPHQGGSVEESDEKLAELGLVNPADSLALVRISDEQQVAFYEPQPGWIVIAEQRRRDTNGVLQAALEGMTVIDLLEIYRRLRPGEDIPQALVDAAGAAPARPSQSYEEESGGALVSPGGGGSPASDFNSIAEESASTNGAGSELGTLRQAHSASAPADFVNNHNGCKWGIYGSFCRVNWANGFNSGTVNARIIKCPVDHYSGNGVAVVITKGATATAHELAVGNFQEYVSFVIDGMFVNFNMQIISATGDSFHAGCRWGHGLEL